MSSKIELRTEIQKYDSVEELSQEYQSLLAVAARAAGNAYAPYSNFHVGAALLLENGEVVSGNNQENVAYPSGLCAERVAIFAAGSQHPNTAFKAIAVTARSGTFYTGPLAPCGACRQVLAEYESMYKKDIKILLKGDSDQVLVISSVADILPLMFDREKLKGK